MLTGQRAVEQIGGTFSASPRREFATTAYYQATVAVPTPTRGQARTFGASAQLVVTSHQPVAGRQYNAACESFRQATQKALNADALIIPQRPQRRNAPLTERRPAAR